MSVEQRLRRLADLAVPDIADWCAVHLVRNDRVEQVAVAHSDPEKVAFVARLQERYPPDPDADGGADPGQPHRRAGVLPRDPRRAPRRGRGRRRAPRPDPVDRPALGAWSCRCWCAAAAWARSRWHTPSPGSGSTRSTSPSPSSWPRTRRSRWTTRGSTRSRWPSRDTLQAALLPAALPDVPGLRLAARYRPQSDRELGIQVGGDLYDVVAGDTPGRWVAVVADVCGKGPHGRGADRADPAHDARRDRPRPRPGRSPAPAQPRDAARGRRRRPADSRRSSTPSSRSTPTGRRAAGERGAPPAPDAPRRPGGDRDGARHRCWASTPTSS